MLEQVVLTDGSGAFSSSKAVLKKAKTGYLAYMIWQHPDDVCALQEPGQSHSVLHGPWHGGLQQGSFRDLGEGVASPEGGGQRDYGTIHLSWPVHDHLVMQHEVHGQPDMTGLGRQDLPCSTS